MYRRYLMTCLLLLASCGADSTNAEPNTATTLTITIQGTNAASGKVLLAVYDDPGEFAKNGRSVAWLAVPASTNTVTLSDFPQGNFAIQAFHDANENDVLDMVNGLPSEGYGSSGNVGRFDQPKFNDAVFEGGTANVKIHYLN